jgi:hypothetical protein
MTYNCEAITGAGAAAFALKPFKTISRWTFCDAIKMKRGYEIPFPYSLTNT